jgi:DNA-binding IclR family transcriptional regulator
LARFREHGLMERTRAGRWRLTRRALPVADAVLSELV